MRICGDFKQTVNQASKPKIQESRLPADLTEGRVTKVRSSQHPSGAITVSTIALRVYSAPGIFKTVMESLLKGIPGVTVYLDNVFITGEMEEKHLLALEEVLSEAGQRLRRDKCVFMAPSVYLGHRIDKQGLHPVAEKVKALQQAVTPKNASELKSYLGLLTYYNRNLSTYWHRCTSY